MNKDHILDCTLRDGGYCNQWKFGADNKQKILNGLVNANINIIECGYLTDRVLPDINSTQFTSFEEINMFVPADNNHFMLVVMINYGEYSIENIPCYQGKGVKGIRVAFHKNDVDNAIEYCSKLKEKGYAVFVQPMISLSYSDTEFIQLIYKVNEIKPYAFYIVDSFGMMKRRNLLRLFYMVEHNLADNIWMGFHSHNNLQLAYSNAQSLIEAQTTRNIIIDTSVYGMGRGAGNLNTELFADYLNEYTEGNYKIQPLLQIIDEVLNNFYKINNWGYSLSKYLSATHELHPGYASYLEDKNTLTYEAMDEILAAVAKDKKCQFDKNYIEKIYLEYMEKQEASQNDLEKLAKVIGGKKVLLLAPGKSIETQRQVVHSFATKEDVIPISINFTDKDAEYFFVSNLIRYRDLNEKYYLHCIVTSNIKQNHSFARVPYDKLLSPIQSVQDNAGLMAIKLMILLGKKEVYLAGFDGYSHNAEENYVSYSKMMITKASVVDEMNEGIADMLRTYGKQIDIKFITQSAYKQER